MRIHRRLTEGAREWAAAEPEIKEDYLFSGSRLAALQEWVEAHRSELNQDEVAFLAASLELSRKQEEIDKQIEGAAQQERITKARQLATLSLSSLHNDPQGSLRLALEAIQETLQKGEAVLPDADHALRAAIAATAEDIHAGHEQEPSILCEQGSPVFVLAVSPDGTRLATVGPDGIGLWQLSKYGNQWLGFQKHAEPLIALDLSRDCKRFAAGSINGAARVRHIDGVFNEPVLLHGKVGFIYSLALDENGTLLATGGVDGATRVWNLERPGDEPIVLLGQVGPVKALAISTAKGMQLATGGLNGTTCVWDVEHRGDKPIILCGHEGPVSALAISPDGERLATGGHDATAGVGFRSVGRGSHRAPWPRRPCSCPGDQP